MRASICFNPPLGGSLFTIKHCLFFALALLVSIHLSAEAYLLCRDIIFRLFCVLVSIHLSAEAYLLFYQDQVHARNQPSFNPPLGGSLFTIEFRETPERVSDSFNPPLGGSLFTITFFLKKFYQLLSFNPPLGGSLFTIN